VLGSTGPVTVAPLFQRVAEPHTVPAIVPLTMIAMFVHRSSPVTHVGIVPAPPPSGIRRYMVGVIPIGAHGWSLIEHYHRWYDAASNCRWGSDKALKARASGPRLVSDGSRFGLYLHCSHSCNFNSVHGSQDYETLPSLDCFQPAR
jgi:hypothetical protein